MLECKGLWFQKNKKNFDLTAIFKSVNNEDF